MKTIGNWLSESFFRFPYALKQLTLKELQHALAVEPGEPGFDEENPPDEELLAPACAGLVIIDLESNIIHLVHYTTQECFERIRVVQFPDAQVDIATACLTYMSFDVFTEGHCRSDEEMEARLQEYPLFGYAVQHWVIMRVETQGNNQRVSSEALWPQLETDVLYPSLTPSKTPVS